MEGEQTVVAAALTRSLMASSYRTECSFSPAVIICSHQREVGTVLVMTSGLASPAPSPSPACCQGHCVRRPPNRSAVDRSVG